MYLLPWAVLYSVTLGPGRKWSLPNNKKESIKFGTKKRDQGISKPGDSQKSVDRMY